MPTKNTKTSKSRGLGKGIGNLFQEEDTNDQKVVVKEVVKEIVKEVPVPAETKLKISQIEPNKNQPRKAFDEDALIELSESIKSMECYSHFLLKRWIKIIRL